MNKSNYIIGPSKLEEMPLKTLKNIAHNLHIQIPYLSVFREPVVIFIVIFCVGESQSSSTDSKLSIILTRSDILILDTHIYLLKNYLFKDIKPIKIYASHLVANSVNQSRGKERISEIHMKLPISFQPNNPRPVSSGSKVLDKVFSVFTSSNMPPYICLKCSEIINDSNNSKCQQLLQGSY